MVVPFFCYTDGNQQFLASQHFWNYFLEEKRFLELVSSSYFFSCNNVETAKE
jgi:hypothetical protein